VAELIKPFVGPGADAVAARLLKRFGSLQRALISAGEEDPETEDSDVLRTIRAARLLVVRAARQDIARAPVSAADPELHRYLQHLLGAQPHEAAHAVFVDSGHGYLSDECIAPGLSSQVVASARHLVARAFDLGARGMILAHNHPSGSASPSEQDIATTRNLGNLMVALDLTLLDHLIVTRREVFSFREKGLL
jgi:DNA repair protein RadC